MYKTTFILLCAAFILLVAVPAGAAVVTVDGGWEPFTFGGVGSSWDDTFTFTALGPVTLTVVDAFLSGDQFEVTVTSVGPPIMFDTSVPTVDGASAGSDYDLALSDPRWSSGSVNLSAGSYTVSGLTLLSPFGGGGGALRVDTVAAVPEPGSVLLFGAGVAGFALWRRRARRRANSF